MGQKSKPGTSELEISVFGPGYGEALAIHIGDGRWILVDSCIDSATKSPATLSYLEGIGVDVARDVDCILATHWHDDHVRGLGEVVAACEDARFICSTAFRHREFLVLTQSEVLGAERTTSGVREFSSILETLASRKRLGNMRCGPVFSAENTLISESEICRVKALSPSSAAVEQTMRSIASLLPKQRRPHLRVAAPSANEGSVALWVDGIKTAALLGADLEMADSDDRGWGAVLGLAPARIRRANLVKIPHHGSATGHDQRVWNELMETRPEAMVTPWTRGGNRLPTADDRQRILSLAPSAVLVGKSPAKKHRYDPAVERVLREVARSRSAAIGRMGHARARSAPDDEGAWQVECFENAEPLSEAA
jgi:hypothetical protein